jgi:cellulose synthase/poly-beta-1,6-N-acetylglucosamine synthase-like glycosyltransferase
VPGHRFLRPRPENLPNCCCESLSKYHAFPQRRADISERHPSVDVIIAEFNELSRQGDVFDSQLDYFSDLSRRYDVILIDDASTDGSWERIVKRSRGFNPGLHLMRMERNGRKVQAVKRAVEASDADYILLSDFDSRIANPEKVPRVIERFEENPSLAGVSLKLVPEGNSLLSKLQDFEYAISRKIFAGYLSPQGKIKCVPGAAGIWKRSVFQQIMKEHSGRHNGDDLESTAIALRTGYRAVTTIVPQTAKAFIAQRTRWDLGGLETYDKERKFFTEQTKNLRSRLGHLVLVDWYAWATDILYPFFIINWILHPGMASLWMFLELSLASLMGLISRNELRTKKELLLVPLFPIYRTVAVIPRLNALYRFVASLRKQPQRANQTQRIQSLPLAWSFSCQQVPIPVSLCLE